MQLNLSTRKIIKLLTQQRIKYQTGNYILLGQNFCNNCYEIIYKNRNSDIVMKID